MLGRTPIGMLMRAGASLSLRTRRLLKRNRSSADAGFSMVETFLALIALSAIGFALHSGTLSAPRFVEASKARAEQARLLEHAVNWARANACLLQDELAAQDSTYVLTVSHRGSEYQVFFRKVEFPASSEPSAAPVVSAVLPVEAQLPAGPHVREVRHVMLLDVSLCGL